MGRREYEREAEAQRRFKACNGGHGWPSHERVIVFSDPCPLCVAEKKLLEYEKFIEGIFKELEQEEEIVNEGMGEVR